MSFKCSAQFNFVLFQKLKIFHTKMTSLVLGMSIFFHNFQIREGTCFLFGIIGIKHDFLCINICWAPREVLKPEASLKGKGFNTTWGAQQMLMYQKSMFDHYYCIKTCFFCLKTLEKLLQKVLFTCTYNGAEKHFTCKCFENTVSRTKTNVIATVQFTDDDISFYDVPGMLIRKNAKPYINSTWIALLIHGFVLVKTGC